MRILTSISRNPRSFLPILGLLLAATAIAVGSGANFTASSANPSNSFSAGTLSMSNSLSGAAILSASNMVPGSSTVGTVTITNTGSADGAFTLSRGALSESPGVNGGNLSAALNLKVEDVTAPASPTTVYNGDLDASINVSLGTFTAGEARDYKFTLLFRDGGTPASLTTGDNLYQGSALTTPFTWSAVTV